MPGQDRGIATDTIFTFNVTASDSLTDFADVYWPLNHSSRMLALFPNLKSLNVKGFVIQHTLLLLETVIFKKPAGKYRQLITTWDWTPQHSGPETLRHAWVNVHHVARHRVSTWHSTLPEPWQQCYATLMDLYHSKDCCGETGLTSSSWPWYTACSSQYSTIAWILGPL